MTHISRFFFFFALKFCFVTTIANVRLNKSTPYDLSSNRCKLIKVGKVSLLQQQRTVQPCRVQWILLRNCDRRESCERPRARTVRVHSTRSLSVAMCSLGIHGSISSFHLFSHVQLSPARMSIDWPISRVTFHAVESTGCSLTTSIATNLDRSSSQFASVNSNLRVMCIIGESQSIVSHISPSIWKFNSRSIEN